MSRYGNTIRAVSPPALMTQKFSALGLQTCEDVETCIAGADVVMTQRIQRERLESGAFSMSAADYHARYGLNHDRLKAAKPDVIVMNPGPVIRNSEITDALADDPAHSVIREQVEMGVAVRMAVLHLLLSTGA